MKGHRVGFPLLVFLVTIVCAAVTRAQDANVPATVNTTSGDYCLQVVADLRRVLDKVKAGTIKTADSPTTLFAKEINKFINAPSCFIQANLSNPAVMEVAPTRVTFWNAVESLSGSQQQGSSLPSSGSTNAVTKPSGPTAIIEEFGGANVTQGTSSLTAQWSPGTMLANLVSTGVVPLCIKGLIATNCVSQNLMNNLSPLTLKITANTSSGTPAVSGTSASGSSNSTSQPVKVSSSGSKGPSFAGLTAQYAFFSKNSAAVKALNNSSAQSSGPVQTYLGAVTGLLKEGNNVDRDLATCEAYSRWLDGFAGDKFSNLIQSVMDSKEPGGLADKQLSNAIAKGYQDLLTQMADEPACKPALEDFAGFFAAIQKARALEDMATQQDKKPVFALEFDLNTPQNQPVYSTGKGTLTWSWGRSDKSTGRDKMPKGNDPLSEAISATLIQPASANATSVSDACGQLKADGGKMQPTRKKALLQSARNETLLAYADAAVSGQSSPTQVAGKSTPAAPATAAKMAAQATVKPLSVTASASGDFYNAAPPGLIPSASHIRDLQAGAEIAYLFTPSSCGGPLRTAIGNMTLAGSYSYQDQTSPAILTGPALSDFTGLPSSTTTAYAKRGVIHLEQVKLGFGTGANISYPLSFTYSNRSELVTHPVWGIQFGVSYNLNSLSSSTSGK